MNINDILKKLGIENYKSANKKFNELKEQFIEMGQLKSDIDIEKFTIMSKGNFIAHQFHMLMRQYVLAQHEMRRMLLEKEKLERLIAEYSNKTTQKIIIDNKETYADLYVKELNNELDLLEVTMTNKVMMCLRFEEMRKILIEKNGGIPPTNDQYQAEEPNYWKWNLLNQAKEQASFRATGIQESIWQAIRQLEEPSLLNDNFRLKILDEQGNINLNNLKELEFPTIDHVD